MRIAVGLIFLLLMAVWLLPHALKDQANVGYVVMHVDTDMDLQSAEFFQGPAKMGVLRRSPDGRILEGLVMLSVARSCYWCHYVWYGQIRDIDDHATTRSICGKFDYGSRIVSGSEC